MNGNAVGSFGGRNPIGQKLWPGDGWLRGVDRRAPTRASIRAICLLLAVFSGAGHLRADDTRDLSATLRSLDSRALPESERDRADSRVRRWLEGLLVDAARRENAAWAAVSSRTDWESFRDQRTDRLRRSLGTPATRTDEPRVRVTGRVSGDGYRIENIVFESRPGLWATANLYVPAAARERMPGIIISHSHHRPKTQGELQDMGMTWARAGCAVLVPDMLGHGERREHPFDEESDWPASFRLSRQDYYFRYNVGLQLQLVGESSMGWMVQDLVRAIDVLVARSDVDADRIILIGAVAGGGDPAGVTAALDRRVAAVVPFNFGGPQPDYAIPENADERFYWFGVPYWESTRALRYGARDGFAHWTIVASVAPRRLIYAHEFSWDRERDPAWPRIQRVFELYDGQDHLGWTTGRGELRGRPPESTHCTNVGTFHRQGIHPLLERWFGVSAEEYSNRRPAAELRSLPADVASEVGASKAHSLALAQARQQIATVRGELVDLDAAHRRIRLREVWSDLLGVSSPGAPPRVVSSSKESRDRLAMERIVLEIGDPVDTGVPVPLLLLSSADSSGDRSAAPTVVVFTRGGKAHLLRELDAGLGALVGAGATACLVDLRGTGETSPGHSRGPFSAGTNESCRALLLGRPLLGARLDDLLGVLRFLRSRPGAKANAMALWAPSLAPPNDPGRDVRAPLRIDDPPRQGDPFPALLALLGALFDDEIAAVAVDGLVESWLSALQTPFLHLPHDVIVPGATRAGDVADLAAAAMGMPRRALRGRGFIDALNRPLSDEELRSTFEPVRSRYAPAMAALDISSQPESDRGRSAARWLVEKLTGD